MKISIYFLFIIASLPVFAQHNYKSNGTGGGDFNSAATWQGGLPNQLGDSIEVLSGDVVTLSAADNNWPNYSGLKIDNGGTMVINNKLNSYHYITNNGTVTGTGTLYVMDGISHHGSVTMSGTGTWSGFSGNIYFASDNITISSGTTINLSSGAAYISSQNNASTAVVVDNLGTFSTTTITHVGAVACTWTNDISSSLSLTGNGSLGFDVLNASANGNTVTFTSATVLTPSSSKYYNLITKGTCTVPAVNVLNTMTINGSTTFSGSLTVNNFIEASTASTNFQNNTCAISGNWTNNSTNSNTNKGAFTFNSGGAQIIGGSQGTLFNSNLILSSGTTVTLQNIVVVNGNLTVNSNATLDCEALQLTGTASGVFTLASGATLILGATGSAANVLFPPNFTAGHCALNSASNVIYQANGAQTVSATPTYGNLTIGAAAAPATAGSLSAGTTSVAGNLLIKGSASLAATSNTLSVTGTSTTNSSSTLSFTTGTFNATGAVTNAGTLSFTSGTGNLSASLNNSGTVTYTGAGNMNIGTTLTNSNTYSGGTSTLAVTGTSSLNAGGTVSFTSGRYNATGTVTNANTSTLSFTTGIATLLSSLTNSGTVIFTGSGTMNVGTTFTNNNIYTGGTSTLAVTGTSSLNAGGTVSFTTGNYNATGAVTNAGTLSFTSGTGNLSTSLNNTATGTITYTGAGDMTVGTTFTNSNTYTGGTSTLNVTGTSTLNGSGTVSFTTGDYNATGAVTNAGILQFTSTGSANLAASLNNSGTVTYTSGGNMSIGTTFTNTGTYTGNSSTLTVSGTSNINSGSVTFTTGLFGATGAVTNAGTVSFTSGTATLSSNLTNSGTFTFTGSGVLNLAGNLDNTGGTYNAGTGLVNLNGTGQNLLGNSIAFYDLLVNQGTNAQTVSLNANESFTDVLTMNRGILGGSDTMTLVSNSSTTASVTTMVAGSSITAQFIVQRYMPRATSEYIALSTAVNSPGVTLSNTVKGTLYSYPEGSLGDWNCSSSNRATSNTTFYMSEVSGPDGNADGFPSVYSYTPPGTYTPIETLNYIVTNAGAATPSGVFLWMGDGNTSSSPMTPFSYVTHGVPTQSGSYTLTANAFVANPYPCAISLGAATYQVFTSGGSWTTVSGNIAMGQAFVPNSTVTITESSKVIANPTLHIKENNILAEDNSVSLILHNDVNGYWTPTTISFANNYTTAYSEKEDALFLSSILPNVPALYTISSNNAKLNLNRLPDTATVIDVPLTAICPVSANYNLTINNLDLLSSYNCVNLIDSKTGQVLANFENSPSYTFNISSPGEEKNYMLRFTKLASNESCPQPTSLASIGASDNVAVVPDNNGAVVKFNLQQETNAVISVYNVLGEKITSDINTVAYINDVHVNLTSGQVYLMRIQLPEGVIIKKFYR